MENILKDKKIILGVTGSIAAYKAPLIVRELVKAGASVNVVMTPAATKFIAPLTLESVSRNNVVVEMFGDIKQTSGAWHVQLANWADLMIIAPCTASTMSKIAFGNSDTALVCVAMAMPKNKPLIISPAMDFDMWLHPATQQNSEVLSKYGYTIIPPADGELASGLIGPGRLPDIPIIIDYIKKSLGGTIQDNPAGDTKQYSPFATPLESVAESIDKDKWSAEFELEKLKSKLSTGKSLSGKKVMITAGPTIEKIDDIRYISNYSTGKMGYAIAEAAVEYGAEVNLISGPVGILPPSGAKLIQVDSADEMHAAAAAHFPDCDIAILTAAVADYTPESKFSGKIKKENAGDNISINLVKTKDILFELATIKKDKQILVGFALEAENVIENAKKKLAYKKCDMIIANAANMPNSGFGGDNNTITIIDRKGNEVAFMPMSKKTAAKKIIEHIIKF